MHQSTRLIAKKSYISILKRNINTNTLSYNESSSVKGFYNGKSVLITGATGFIGKVLVEKLLYSCNGIDKVYILTRAKEGVSLEQRVQALTASPIFQRLKNSRPDDLNKIVPVAGDLEAPGLGLCDEDEEALLRNVSVVFHSAATINFNEPLRVAMGVNFDGTRKILGLCKRMPNIRALVHVSTAYCNTDQEVVEEWVYPPPANIDDVYKFIDQHGDDDIATRMFLNGRPNTYTFSKALSEAYLAKNHGEVPTVILRPSIVTAALNEPLEGWLDGWQGNTSMLAMAARGFHRAMLCNSEALPDLIPVDYAVNMAIVASACTRKGEVSVFNCCTSSVKPITWRTMVEYFLKASKADRFHKLPFPRLVLTRSRIVLNTVAMFTQTIPAHVMDAWRRARGKRPKYVRLHKQIINLRNELQFFSNHKTWVMRSERACALAASLTGADATCFPCHPAKLHWPSYMPVYYKGVKRFLFRNKL